MFPRHILNNHPARLVIRPIKTAHCMYAYVKNGTSDIDFCVCLTCKKGALEDGHGVTTTRWSTRHSTKTSCKLHHVSALNAFKQSIGVSIDISVAIATPPVCTEDVFNKFWREVRHKTTRTEFMDFIESNTKAMATLCDSDEEEEYIFCGKELLIQLIDAAAANYKELRNCKIHIKNLEETVETQTKRIDDLETVIKKHTEEINMLKAQIQERSVAMNQ